jgi:hypothetical protein
MANGTRPTGAVGSRIADIVQFAVKTCIFAAVGSACTLFVADWVIGRLELSMARSVSAVREEMFRSPLEGSQFWGQVERDLAWAADPTNDLSPARKRKLIGDLRIIVARWRPVVEAVRDEIRERSLPDQR